MESFNIMAFDPGTTTIGVSIYRINAHDLSIMDIETTLIDLNIGFIEIDLVDNLLNRLYRLNLRVKELIHYYQPKLVGIEASFYFKMRPMAYGPLSQSIMAIELAIQYVNPNIRIFKFPPKTIKKIATDVGSADKDDVLSGIANIQEIANKINPYLLSEHEVDSLAINYTLLDYIRYNQVILLMLY